MNFVAKARYVRISPYKLRPIADVVRGKSALYAINWLSTYKTKRAEPMKKVIASAVANATSLENHASADLVIKEIRVDQGPIYRYSKPGTRGSASIQRKRFSHISVVIETRLERKAQRG
ncbi:MAG: 50S ribosomal protein L22 [candidate division TM6 bacterium GW2011_GWE2_41_16]|nr:MAG: 50S ribosomal protein L22 [candidate division TM6 bacterium GW2011_GWE2_41_16]